MTTVRIQCDELYPVYTMVESPGALEIDLPDDLVDRLQEATNAFTAIQRELRELLTERHRAEQEARKRAEQEARRAERGQRRPRRRPHPERTAGH